jgi:aminoglycoside phosphotransferase (APT) family kinase protein
MCSRMHDPEPDVVQALAALGLEPRSFAPIGGYPRWRAGRVTYRVELTSGRVVKVRRVTRPGQPTQAAALVRALADPDLPAPLVITGLVMIEDWVDGVPLAEIRVSGREIDAAADLLGRLHARTSIPGRRFRRVGPVGPLLTTTLDRIDALTERGALTRTEARRLVSEVRRGLPERGARGPVHGDLCAENLVLASDGRVVSIDNERVRIDFLDFDLARTWTRWPMPERWRARFERRYAEWGRPVPVPVEAAAWRVSATVKSAMTIRTTPGTGPKLARARLERLLNT